MRRLPDPPELPAAARPPWPPWYAPVALIGSLVAISLAIVPLLPLLLLAGISDTLGAIALLVLALLQDGVFVGAAVLFAAFKRPPRPWHFGVRATPLWPTVGWTVLAFARDARLRAGPDRAASTSTRPSVEELGELSGLAGIAVAIVVVLLAPVAEEIFFRAFFYRALRTKLRIWLAATITGCVFASVHLQYYSEPALLLIIAGFGIGQCLLYERTGSLFAVIATHAAFNTVASLEIAPIPALVLGRRRAARLRAGAAPARPRPRARCRA